MAGLARGWLRYLGSLIPRPRASTLSQPESWMVEAFGGRPSSSGIRINHYTAMTVPTVYACVRVISSTMAALPLNLRKRSQDGASELADRHPLFDLLHTKPNRWQTSYEWRVWVWSNILLRGNAYCFIVRNPAGVIQELIPLEGGAVTAEWIGTGQERRIGYWYGGEYGSFPMLESEVLHFRGMPDDEGLRGLSVIAYHRDTIGEAKAGQETASRSMANGSKLSGLIKIPQAVDSKVREAVADEWNRAYGGAFNAGRVAVLGAEADFKPISMTMQDAQFIEQRKMSRQDIYAIFGVPPMMVGDHDRSTFSNAEQNDLHYAKHTITPHASNFEQTVHRDLLTERERKRYFFKLNMNSLMRGDFKTRTEGYRTMIETGILSPNEARSLEDMNKREGGDVYLTPLNHREAGPDARELPEPVPARTDPELDDDEDEDPEPANDNAAREAAARALLSDAAERVVIRDVKAMATGARHLRSKRSAKKVEAALDGCEAHFAKITSPTLSVVAPDCDVEELGRRHRSRLVDAIAPAIQAKENAADELDRLVGDWSQTAKQEILNDALL